MEKDHFRDRPEDAGIRDRIRRGDTVFICLKENQKTAKELRDLTLIQVKGHHTSRAVHPRGIKVYGTEMVWNPETEEWQAHERHGRVTYIVRDGNRVPTKDGDKCLVRTDAGPVLRTPEEMKGMYQPAAVLCSGNAQFRLVPDAWLWTAGPQEFKLWLHTARPHGFRLQGGGITGYLYGRKERWKDCRCLSGGRPVDFTPGSLSALLETEVLAGKKELTLREWKLIPFRAKHT